MKAAHPAALILMIGAVRMSFALQGFVNGLVIHGMQGSITT
jgi:hypothetical protein